MKDSINWLESLKFTSGLKCKACITTWEEGARLEPGRPIRKGAVTQVREDGHLTSGSGCGTRQIMLSSKKTLLVPRG